MGKKLQKISEQHKQLNQEMKSNGVKVVPIFKKPLDINKLGNAILSLATKLAEEKSADTKSELKEKDSPRQENPDYGGSRE